MSIFVTFNFGVTRSGGRGVLPMLLLETVMVHKGSFFSLVLRGNDNHLQVWTILVKRFVGSYLMISTSVREDI